MVTLDEIRVAADRISGVAHRTPVMTCSAISERAGAALLFKCENFQRVGAFKFRGAYNAMRKLKDSGHTGGVLTYSSGNHAQAVALAGRILDMPCVIVMPFDAPEVKRKATEAYGGEVVLYDREEETREALGRKLAAERGLVVVPPYDHPDVIAGQGTVALELLEETTNLDVLYVCLGGGGLLSGCAVAAKSLRPDITVVGVEPEAADDGARSFRTGVLHSVSNPDTVADGARTPSLGEYTFPLIRQFVDDVITVSDAQILAAMCLLMERAKLVVEPTGALSLAGALSDSTRCQGRVGVVISGGNVDLSAVSGLLS